MPRSGPPCRIHMLRGNPSQGQDLAERYNTLIHIHVAETKEEVDGFTLTKGLSPVEYLDSLICSARG